jgi:nucleotide-binding universal stress UspA family protein
MKQPASFVPSRILCPFDFSDLSQLALKYAAAGATAFGTKLTVLHAHPVELPPYFTRGESSQLLKQINASKRSALNSLTARVHKTLGATAETPPINYIVLDQHPAEAIHATADKTAADLIVMGTHGRRGSQRLLLGSVAENVIRHSRIPVFTVRQKEHEFIDPASPTSLPALRNILCPVNFTPVARIALQHAASIAQKFGAQLTVLCIAEARGVETKEKLCSWTAPVLPAGVRTSALVRTGRAAEQIVAYAEKNQPDLIVIGAQPRDKFGASLFGTTTELVLRRAPVPVLTVPLPG